MKASKLLALSGLMLPSLAFAHEPGHLDIYYIPSAEVEISIPDLGSADDDGDGFGAKVFAPLGQAQKFFIAGEYQSVSYDESDLDLDQMRVGAGLQSSLQTGALAVYGEYASLDLDDAEADGFGVHGRLSFPLVETVRLFGQLGYLMLEDDSDAELEGLEWSIGASVDFNRNFGGFVDYRQTSLEDDDDIEYDFSDLRLGVSIRFG